MAAAITGEDDRKYIGHCVIVPYPVMSHVNPMLQFANHLKQHNIKITLILSRFLANSKTTHLPSTTNIETFSDGYDHGIPPGTSYDTAATRFHQFGPPTLRHAIRRLLQFADPILTCLVYDAFLYWALDVAEEFGLMAAAFFTQSCGVDRIYHHVSTGNLTVPIRSSVKNIVIPGLPTTLKIGDLPSIISDNGSYPTIFKSALHQFRGLEKANWVFLNSFYKLEEEVIDYMTKYFPIKTIGPTIPSMYLDKRISNNNQYEMTIQHQDAIRLDWMDQRKPGSVIYVSFGSLAMLSKAQMVELAWGLKSTGKNFLWVVSRTEQSKLPEGFIEESSEQGLIVEWCSQLAVLAHDAVSCFVSHCGWNSTLEAMSIGVPILAMPQWTDQPTNAKFVEEVWKVGIRATMGEDGVVDRKTINRCVEELMKEERGKAMRKNARKWKELARAAMDDGGSSDKNILEFVTKAFGSHVPS